VDSTPHCNPHFSKHQEEKKDPKMPVYAQIELAFARWAASQPDVRAVVVFGSQARSEHPACEWSDLDLMIILNQPGELSASTDWLSSIGEVQFIARETVTVNLFWVHAIQTVTLIRRGERWRACHQLQVELKGILLTFIERQARLRFGPEHKIWPRGCYLEDWADPRTVAELPGCFDDNPSGESWDFLEATCDLFHWLAVEIAERLGYTYPEASEVYSREWIHCVDTSHLL
jgi:predicted nucleotidyltransferase